MLGSTGPVKIRASKPGSIAGHLVVLAACSATPASIFQPAFVIAWAAALPGLS